MKTQYIFILLYSMLHITQVGYAQCTIVNCDDLMPVVDLNMDCELLMPDFENDIELDACAGYDYSQNPIQAEVISNLMDGATIEVTITLTNPTSMDETVCVFNLTVTDDIPIAACPDSDLIVVLDEDGEGSLSAELLGVESSDNCDDLVFEVDGESSIDFVCDDIGGNMVVLTITDISGQSATAGCNIEVVDNMPVEVVCSTGISVELNQNGMGTLTADEVGGSSTDNCDIELLINDATSLTFNCDDINVTEVMLTVIDASNESTTANCAISILDTIPPSLSCASNIIVELGNNLPVVLNTSQVNGASSSDNCAITDVLINGQPSLNFNCSNLNTTSVTLTVSDASGNAASNNCAITVTDIAPPAVSCNAGLTFELPLSGALTLTAAQIGSGTDNCSISSETINGLFSLDFTCSNLGNNDIVYQAVDGSGRSSNLTCIVNITAPDIGLSEQVSATATTISCDIPTITLSVESMVAVVWTNSVGTTLPSNNGVLMINETNIPDNNSETFTATSCAGSTGLCCQSVSISISQNTVAPDISISGLPLNNMICQNMPLTLMANSNVNNTSFIWSDAVSSPNPSITFPTNNSGVFNVSLQGENNVSGCSSTVMNTITVNAQPVVTWNGLTNICSTRPAFSLSSSASPLGGTFTGPGVVANNTFNPSSANIGDNSIIYRFMDPITGCENSMTSIINVTSPPNSSAMTSTPEVCAGGTILLSSSIASSGLTYSWTGPGGFEEETDIQTFPRQNATTSMSGNYTLTITDNLGCVYTSSTISIDVDNPIQTRIQEVDIECNGDTALLTAVASQGSGSFNYSWNTGEMNSSVNVPASTIPYSVTVSDNGPCDNVIVSVLVDEPDQVITTLTILDESCSGAGDGSIEFSNSGGTGGFNTELSNGLMSSSVSNTFGDLIDGNYTVTVTDGNGCSVITSSNVAPGTESTLSISSSPLNTCDLGDNITLVAMGTAINNLSWSINGDAASNSNSLTIGDNEGPGSYRINLIGNRESQTRPGISCEATEQERIITVFENPRVSLSAPSEICDNQSATLTATPSGGTVGNYTFEWNNNIGEASNEIPVTPFSDTRYIVTVTDGNSCSNTDASNIEVHRSPDAGFNAMSTVNGRPLELGVAFSLESMIALGDADIDSYEWEFSDELTIFTNGGQDSTITRFWNQSNVEFPVYNDDINTFIDAMLKITDDNLCMDVTNRRINFENPDDCQINPINPQIVFCEDEIFSIEMIYQQSSASIARLSNIEWEFPPNSGGRLISMDDVTGLPDASQFTVEFEFENAGSWDVKAALMETPPMVGCDRTGDDRINLQFLILENINVNNLSASIQNDSLICRQDLQNNNLILNYTPAEEDVIIEYVIDGISQTNVNGGNGQIVIPLSSADLTLEGSHILEVTEVRNQRTELESNCTSFSGFSLSLEVENCGCEATFEDPNLEAIDTVGLNLGVTSRLIPICSSNFIEFDTDFNTNPGRDEIVFIVSDTPSQDEIIESIQNLNGANLQVGNRIGLDDVQEIGGLCDTVFIFPAIKRDDGCLFLSENGQQIVFLEEPQLNLEMDQADFCLNDINAEVLISDDNMVCNLTGINPEVSDTFDFIDGPSEFSYRDPFDNGENIFIFLDSLQGFTSATEYTFRVERTYDYGEEQCFDTDEVSFQIGSGISILSPDTTFIQWWPGNILASSLQSDSIQQYRYLWGRDNGIPIEENTEWYVVIDEDDFDGNGIPINEEDEPVNYYVDVWEPDTPVECRLRLYYTGDGFAPTPRTGVTVSEDNIVIYPNPSFGDFTIVLPSDFEFIEDLKIHSVMGEFLYKQSLDERGKSIEVSLSDFHSGLHICTLYYKNGSTISQKIILE